MSDQHVSIAPSIIMSFGPLGVGAEVVVVDHLENHRLHSFLRDTSKNQSSGLECLQSIVLFSEGRCNEKSQCRSSNHCPACFVGRDHKSNLPSMSNGCMPVSLCDGSTRRVKLACHYPVAVTAFPVCDVYSPFCVFFRGYIVLNIDEYWIHICFRPGRRFMGCLATWPSGRMYHISKNMRQVMMTESRMLNMVISFKMGENPPLPHHSLSH